MSSTRPRASGLWARGTMKATCRTCGSLPAAGFSRAMVRRAGLAQVPLRDRGDSGRHGGREEHGLARGRGRLEDRLQVLGEAHVEHLVGLVQHHDADGVEAQGPSPHVIEGAPGRRHHDLGSSLQGPDLLIHGRSAVEGQDAQADALGVLVDRLRDLHGQLARGHEDESAGATPLLAVFGDPLEHGQGEGRGLAGPGRRLAEHIASGKQHGNGLALDRCRFLVAERGDRAHQGGGEAERGEVGGLGFGRCRHSDEIVPRPVPNAGCPSQSWALARERTSALSGRAACGSNSR